ncbi:MAG: hypothetical protein IJY23_05115 [Clostridia bacterium]|nr:hypothetical protein [Clostridia bacterium]
MKKFSKILVLLLSVALVCTGLILAVSADDGNVAKVGETEYATLAAALDAVTETDSEVTLIRDASLESYSLTKSATVNLNGFTLSSSPADGDAEYAFYLKADGITLDIVGDGAIKLDGMLAYSPNSANLNVAGKMAGIDITHTGSINSAVISASAGSWTFTNANIVATPNNDYAFYMKDNSTPALTFNAVTIDTIGSTSTDQNSGVLRMSSKGKLSMDHCTVKTNAGFINFQNNTSATVEDYVTIKNSWVSAIDTTSAKTGIFGSYVNINSDIYVKDSYLESSYRALMLKGDGAGKLILDNSYFVVDNCNRNEATSFFMRSGVIRVTNGSAICFDESAAAASSKGYFNFASNSDSTIYLEEGARINHKTFAVLTELAAIEGTSYYNAKNETYVKFVEVDSDGNETYVTPSASTNYTFVYDPVGNLTAPYVLTKISDSAPQLYTKDADGNITASKVNTIADHSTLSDYVYFYHDGGTRTGQYNQYETINGTKSYISHGTKYVNGNAAYHYTPNGRVAVSNGVDTPINFWLGLTTGLSEASLDLFVFEFDLGAGSADGFAPGHVSIHARGSATGDGNKARQFFHVAQDGTVTNDTLSDFKSYQLDTNRWNRVSVVIETASAKGKAYVFIDGNYIGYAQGYESDGAYLFAPRYDSTVNKRDFIGPVTLFDNVGIRVYGEGKSAYTVSGESDARAYLTNGCMPWNFGNTVSRELADITVGGIEYPDVNSAITAASALGTVPQINGEISKEQTVTQNYQVSANGYTIPLSDSSYPADIKTDANGNNYYYDFNESYNLTVKYKFFFGDLNKAEQLSDPAYWTEELECAIGMTPSAIYNGEELEDILAERGSDYLFASHIGWSMEKGSSTVDETPLSLEFAEANKENTIEFYPVYSEPFSKGYLYVVLDVNGEFRFGYDMNKTLTMYNSDWMTRDVGVAGAGTNGTAAPKLEYGETFVVLKDDVLSFGAAFNSPRATKATAEELVFNFDLNGHRVKINQKGNGGEPKSMGFLSPQTGETMNLYSSRPGAYLESIGYVGKDSEGVMNYNLSGGILFKAAYNNATVNVGTVTVGGVTYDGSNLTLSGDQIASTSASATGSSINIEGATLVRSTVDNLAMFMTRDSDSVINVKGCTVVNVRGGSIAGNHHTNGLENSGAINFTDTLILTKNNGANLIYKNSGNNTVTFTNCVTNGTINADEGILIVKDTAAYGCTASAPEGYVLAKYNLPMTLANTITYKAIASDGTQGADTVYTDYSFASHGSAAGSANVILPLLTYKTVPESETVTVTWSGIATNEAKTEAYVKGGNVVGIAVDSCESNVISLVHDGGFEEELAQGITEDATYTPTYTVKAAVTGLQTNLSLYADFGVNLYIPTDYAEYVTVDGKTETVTVNGKTYTKVTIDQKCDAASKAVVFTLKISETIGETVYEDTVNVSVSIVSYATKILEGESFSAADKVLVYYMLNYANEAVKYFDKVENDETIAALLENYSSVGGKYTVDSTLNAKNNGLSDVFAGVAIDANSSPAFVLTLNEGFKGTVTVSYAGSKATRTFTVTEASKANDTLKIDGMKAYNFGTDLTVTAEGTLNGAAVSISGQFNLDAYVEHAESNALAHLDLVKALRAYAEVSELYMLGTLDDAITEQAAGDEVVEEETTEEVTPAE